ncbi:MAG: hypothetical protein NC191_04310 [Muribaculaceae bacterium]|nr:hypothetical protein [Muribaculaceae bacterium]
MDLRVNNFRQNTVYGVRQARKYPVFTSSFTTFESGEELKQYKKAKKYADSLIKKDGFVDLNKCNLSKLEGIQNGIEVFDGLNMKQIYLLQKYANSITLFRGCSNGCVHCFADAKPIHINKDDKDRIKAFSWEDFDRLMSGMGELSKRLGINKDKGNILRSGTVNPFLDADSMEVIIKDKDGVEHDYIDITKRINNDANKYVLFDTSGWNPKSEVMQKRAEKYVEFMKSEWQAGNTPYRSINISLNPFHKLNSKYVEYINSDVEKAQKFRNLYTDRMANVFYTFTPIFEHPEFRLLNRAISEDVHCDENYKIGAHRKLIEEIRQKLENKYISAGMASEDIEKNLKIFDKHTSEIRSKMMVPLGRLKNIYAPDDLTLKMVEEVHQKVLAKPKSIVKSTHFQLIVVCNGKVYATHLLFDIFPTDICLNLENKDKESVNLYNRHDQLITTDEIMDKLSLRRFLNKVGLAKLFR